MKMEQQQVRALGRRVDRSVNIAFVFVWSALAAFWTWALVTGSSGAHVPGSLLLALAMVSLSVGQLLKPRRISHALTALTFILLGVSIYLLISTAAV